MMLMTSVKCQISAGAAASKAGYVGVCGYCTSPESEGKETEVSVEMEVQNNIHL
jgi:hypothetical protein